MKHVLVTNDFPPKVGGIQSYLWELWRRLPPDDVTVLTTPYRKSLIFDQDQQFRVVRARQRWLLPTVPLARRINSLVREVGAELVVLDPVVPLGFIGPFLTVPYVLIGHGAEFTIPRSLPLLRHLMGRLVDRSAGLIGSGAWVERSMRHASSMADGTVPSISIPPGVDSKRFGSVDEQEREQLRAQLGVGRDEILVLGVSRLVPRKGFDRLIRAVALLGRSDVHLCLVGSGREAVSLDRLGRRLNVRMTMLGRVPHDDLPVHYGAADIFCMPCHNRWFGLEQEGFGIVFLEAAASGVAAVAGLSGGSSETVRSGETGLVVGGRVGVVEVADALRQLIDDPAQRRRMGDAGREWAVTSFDYDNLSYDLQSFLEKVGKMAGN